MRNKAVKCIETGEIFVSATEAARKFECSHDLISSACSGKTKTAKKMHFCFVENDEINTVKNANENRLVIQEKAVIESEGSRTNGNCKAVMCIDTGEVFNSASDAAEHYGIGFGNMSNACRGIQKTAKGMRFCYIKDINCHLDVIAKAINKANAYDMLIEKENMRKELVAKVDTRQEEIHAIEFKMHEMAKQLAEAKAGLEAARVELQSFN